jgi:Fic family protein
LDDELKDFERISLDPEIELTLIHKNELLVSFAISKAENSNLTLEEAAEVYNLVLNDKEFDFVAKKIRNKEALTEDDYDKFEFFNIARAFRKLAADNFSLKDLSPDFIRKIHLEITKGLDIFHGHLSGFTPYKSGSWRDNDDIRVGSYVPLNFREIPDAVSELVAWFQKNPSIVNVAAFHTVLYAIHPFNNGNKRVCRVLEHLLFKVIGLNRKNLYATSYAYHKEKAKYYKYLLSSLDRRNINIFSSFILEALVDSMLGVVKTSLEIKRSECIDQSDLDKETRKILKPLIKRSELQFKNFYMILKNKVSRQTFVNHISLAVENGILSKRDSGKATFYSLNLKTDEEVFLRRQAEKFKGKIAHFDLGI